MKTITTKLLKRKKSSSFDDENNPKSEEENVESDNNNKSSNTKKEKKKKKKKRPKKSTTQRSPNSATENTENKPERGRSSSANNNNPTNEVNITHVTINQNAGNSHPSTTKPAKNKKDSLSISIDDHVRESLPITVTIDMAPTSTTSPPEVEEEKKESNNTQSSMPAPVVIRHKSSPDASTPKANNAKTLAGPSVGQAQTSTDNKAPSSYVAPPTMTLPRSNTATGFPSLVAASLVVKEKESVLMNMDVAEVKDLHVRSQRQLAGMHGSETNEPVQKTGQTLKEAIAAAQKQAMFANKMGDEQYQGSPRTMQNRNGDDGYRREYAGTETMNQPPQNDLKPARAERHEHPGKKKKRPITAKAGTKRCTSATLATSSRIC